MRNLIYVFLVFVLVFFLNLLLYIYVDGYRDFIKSLKYWDEQPEYSARVDDSYNVNSIEEKLNSTEVSDFEKWLLLDLWIDSAEPSTDTLQDDKEILLEEKKETIAEKILRIKEKQEDSSSETEELPSIWREAKLTQTSEYIISSFISWGLEIQEREEKDDLLDIAQEYPDEYIQYGNDYFDLYILSTRTYKEVDDIFSVLAPDMPFSLNKLNNFWARSFYINLDRPDEKVRFIFEYNREVFGVKVKKPQFSEIKNIIINL